MSLKLKHSMATINRTIAALANKIDARCVDVVNKSHGGVITHPKPMDSTSECFIFDANMHLRTMTLAYDENISHWNELVVRAGPDSLNVVPTFIQQPSDTRNNKVIVFSNTSSFARIIGLYEATYSAMIGHRAVWSDENCYVVADTLFRTNEAVKNPGLLVGRLWTSTIPHPNGLVVVPGYEEGTYPIAPLPPAHDIILTPALRIGDPVSKSHYEIFKVPECEFHVE